MKSPFTVRVSSFVTRAEPVTRRGEQVLGIAAQTQVSKYRYLKLPLMVPLPVKVAPASTVTGLWRLPVRAKLPLHVVAPV